MNKNTDLIKIENDSMIKEYLEKCGVKNLYYMLSRDNLPSILERGILCRNKALLYMKKDISYKKVQSRRSYKYAYDGKIIDIHDYVPLYFVTNTPTRYVIEYGKGDRIFGGKEPMCEPGELIFIELDALKVFSTPGIIFTDGNSASKNTKFYINIQDLDKLDWNMIYKDMTYKEWRRVRKTDYYREYKRKKCSEVLVPNQIPIDFFNTIIVGHNDVFELLKDKCKNNIEILKRFVKVDTFYLNLYEQEKLKERMYGSPHRE